MKIKTTLLLLLLLLASVKNYSQNVLGKKKGSPTQPTFTYTRPQNCALNTSFLMLDIKQNKDAAYLKERYNLNEDNSILFVDAFIKVSPEFEKNKVEELGVVLNTKAGVFYTARIPIYKLEELFLVNGIINVEIGEKVYQTLDNARALTNVNQVHAGTGLPQAYTGNGVIVGVIDDGFDYTHPNFRNLNNQQTRISKVWEQNGPTAPNMPYGTEYVGSTAILNKMRDKVDESHGTHVAGIAAGSGGIFANSAFRGVAYDSEIVLVSTNKTDVGVLNGIQYVFNYSSAQNKPAVVNMSLGSHFGPHDGTSDFDSACNSIVGPGKILVGSTGNDGDKKTHINKNLSSSNDLLSFVNFPYLLDGSFNNPSTKGSTSIDIWGEVGKNFNVAVNVYNVITNTYVNWTPYIYTATNTSNYSGVIYDNDTSTSQDGCIVQIGTENANVNNNKPHAIITIDNSWQDDFANHILLEIRSSDNKVNAWHFGDGTAIFENFSFLPSITAGATDGNTNSTITEIGGTGNSIISVGAYTSKNSWTSFSGINQQANDFSNIGSIAAFSSKGPTVDGRIKPDITAPGNILASSVSRYDSNFTSTSPRTVSGLATGANQWWFGMLEGTSMAAPMVTGIIALWLQRNPFEIVNNIKYILQESSIRDNFTGTGNSIPNNTWGFGKIDALAGMQLLLQLDVDTFNPENNFVVYPNPTSSKIMTTSNEFYDRVEVYNVLGQKTYTQVIGAILDNQEIDLSGLPKGTYILKFIKAEKTKSIKVVKQ